MAQQMFDMSLNCLCEFYCLVREHDGNLTGPWFTAKTYIYRSITYNIPVLPWSHRVLLPRLVYPAACIIIYNCTASVPRELFEYFDLPGVTIRFAY